MAVWIYDQIEMKKLPPQLTPRIIADMRAGDECGDPDHPGLRVRRTNAACVFFYCYCYRARDGALCEIKLGGSGAVTLAEARKAVAKLKLEREKRGQIHSYKSSVRNEARQQREAERQAKYTVEKLVEDYITEKLDKQKRGYEGARLLRRDFLPKLGDRAATALTRRDLQDEVIRPMLRRAPRGGTYLLSRIRCAYVHAAGQGRILALMFLTDSQVQLWLDEMPDRPWVKGAREQLIKNGHRTEAFTYEECIREMDGAGVDRVMIVPGSWEGDRIDYALKACEAYPERFGVMARIPQNKPEEPHSELPLEPCERRADGRGRYAQSPGGSAERTVFDNT